MKKIITVTILLFTLFIQKTEAQTGRVIGPVEKKLTDSLCATLNRLDISKITTATEAKSAFMSSFLKQSAMLEDVATERGVAIDDQEAMHDLGVDIGKNLLKINCDAFLNLSAKMVEKKVDDAEDAVKTSVGYFKRIELKGFNYIVISDQVQSEKSFIWLKQFTGSEIFMGSTTKMIGKKLKLSWQEIEVYLPQAKGYYKLKQITAIELL